MRLRTSTPRTAHGCSHQPDVSGLSSKNQEMALEALQSGQGTPGDVEQLLVVPVVPVVSSEELQIK